MAVRALRLADMLRLTRAVRYVALNVCGHTERVYDARERLLYALDGWLVADSLRTMPSHVTSIEVSFRIPEMTENCRSVALANVDWTFAALADPPAGRSVTIGFASPTGEPLSCAWTDDLRALVRDYASRVRCILV